MGKRVFNRDFLVDELGLPWNKNNVIEDTIEEVSRWSICHKLIFEVDEKYYKTWYSEGATQFELPWDDEQVECIEVKKAYIVKEDWLDVEEAKDAIQALPALKSGEGYQMNINLFDDNIDLFKLGNLTKQIAIKTGRTIVATPTESCLEAMTKQQLEQLINMYQNALDSLE